MRAVSSAARRALVEWLDAVPANKVADGSFDLDRARQIARWIFVDNPVRILNLGGRITVEI